MEDFQVNRGGQAFSRDREPAVARGYNNQDNQGMGGPGERDRLMANNQPMDRSHSMRTDSQQQVSSHTRNDMHSLDQMSHRDRIMQFPTQRQSTFVKMAIVYLLLSFVQDVCRRTQRVPYITEC